MPDGTGEHETVDRADGSVPTEQSRESAGGHEWTPAADPDVEAALAVVGAHVREVHDRELDRALSELDLSDRETAVVERLAERIVADLLGVPAARLAAAAGHDTGEDGGGAEGDAGIDADPDVLATELVRLFA